ncbi:MAG: acetylornithine deacetylase [Alphaproteobacteria bacterium CG_4_10_14_0_2_um_filter_63_37]|nr:MAG: acetylornithine deacetylase [Proteobacteria bacterium CG1_02_64_396]PJA25519.1 MAG: acetylornithine deacetylase [Alphaproteobacteria bacterium CG_4_10_14_0_2_um_filter_63_37]
MNPTPTLMQMLAALIAAPSVSSVSPDFDTGNQAVIGLLAQWLSGLGFAVEVLPLPGRPGKANLIATLGKGPGGLVLAGHTDTVPCDPHLWRFDPFKLTEEEGRLYGLGTCDMKGFFPLVIEALRGFEAGRRIDPATLTAPIIVVATADEESSMAGALELVRLGRPKGRYAVIGEPTGLKPVRMHKGILMESVRLTGRSGHSSDPSLGLSALEGMSQVLADLIAWRGQLQAQHRNPGFHVPVPTLNLGRIHGGDNPNRICGHCELHIDIRPLPGMELEELRQTLDARVAQAVAGSGLQIEVTPLFPGTPAMETPATSALVQAAERLTGHSAGAVAFGTEGPYFTALGMETLILGPGNIDQAHQPDEWLGLEQINPTIALIRQLVTRFCGAR